VHGEVDVAIGSDAAKLLRDVVDHGLPAVVELGLTQLPGLVIPDHGVKLVDSGDEGELGVLEHLGVSSRQLLVFHLLSNTGGAYQTVILASLAGEFTVALGLLHSTSLTGLPHTLMSTVHASGMCDMVVVVNGGGTGARSFGGAVDRLD